MELVFEFVFEILFRILGQGNSNQGFAVIGVSIAISLLTLPLYRRADAVQQKERDIQKKLSHWVSHIKKTFKGDERYMMLQTYYRENNYSPIMALNGSLSLLLEIPFFMAAYHFLSHLEVLNGASFGLISDLGKADGLIKIGSFSINALPILMTLINCISSAIYLKGFPVKDKIQTYGMALIFLVLLYNSPSGLVVYWTCNNIFSLVKNVFYKLKNPKKVAVILCAVLGTILTMALFVSGKLNSRKKNIVVLLFQYAMLLPLFFHLAKSRIRHDFNFINIKATDNMSLFVLSGSVLFLLCGLVVPLNIIVSSPNEFIINGQNPIHFISVSLAKAAGIFLAWPLCMRLLFKREKNIWVLDSAFIFIAFVALLNVFVFPMKAGLLSIFLKYENEDLLSLSAIGIKKVLLNFVGIVVICSLLIFLIRKNFVFLLRMLTVVVALSLVMLGGYNLTIVHRAYDIYLDTIAKSGDTIAKSGSTDGEVEPIFHFTRTGKNVFVIMLDRAAGAYLPYIFNERPDLYEDYEGFVYYPNTVSFSLYTLAGAPPLYGGYEYVPMLQNKKTEKSLLQKREEAISLLPRIFAKNGFSATMTNMPWIGETPTSDFFFMDKYTEKITSLFTNQKYREVWLHKINSASVFADADETLKRNFICNSIVSIMPYIARKHIYDKGQYFHTTKPQMESKNFEGDAWNLLNDYSELDCLPMACDTASTQNMFVFMQNPMPHHPAFLQYPDYTISQNVIFDEKNPLSHDANYHVNAASLILLGKWLRWLKENGVYDNTRIIISADHGSGAVKTDAKLEECQMFPAGGEQPLLLIKDFNSTGKLKTDETFMTNADVPSLAVKNVIENPVNPATGTDITSLSLKNPAVITLADWQETKNTFGDVDTPSKFSCSDDYWYAIDCSIFDAKNWRNISP